jgi:hypothetical protein
MKSLVYAMVAASALSIPVASFAQTSPDNNGPVTRAQVRQDLINVEQAGYRPGNKDPYYPDDIQAAEQRVNAQQGYGGVAAGTAQSGGPATMRVEPARPANMGGIQSQSDSLYLGH